MAGAGRVGERRPLGLFGAGGERFGLEVGREVNLLRFSFGDKEIDQTTSMGTSQMKGREGDMVVHDLGVSLPGFKLHVLTQEK